MALALAASVAAELPIGKLRLSSSLKFVEVLLFAPTVPASEHDSKLIFSHVAVFTSSLVDFITMMLVLGSLCIPSITYYWTGLLILDHSYLVGNLTNSKIAETKALEHWPIIGDWGYLTATANGYACWFKYLKAEFWLVLHHHHDSLYCCIQWNLDMMLLCCWGPQFFNVTLKVSLYRGRFIWSPMRMEKNFSTLYRGKSLYGGT